jgi:hypothetical protein
MEVRDNLCEPIAEYLKSQGKKVDIVDAAQFLSESGSGRELNSDIDVFIVKNADCGQAARNKVWNAINHANKIGVIPTMDAMYANDGICPSESIKTEIIKLSFDYARQVTLALQLLKHIEIPESDSPLVLGDRFKAFAIEFINKKQDLINSLGFAYELHHHQVSDGNVVSLFSKNTFVDSVPMAAFKIEWNISEKSVKNGFYGFIMFTLGAVYSGIINKGIENFWFDDKPEIQENLDQEMKQALQGYSMEFFSQNRGKINFRRTPSEELNIIDSLEYGTKAKFYDCKTGWFKVEVQEGYYKGKIGWVANSNIRFSIDVIERFNIPKSCDT